VNVTGSDVPASSVAVNEKAYVPSADGVNENAPVAMSNA